MRPGWKWVAAMAVLVLGIAVSVSGAATSGSKRDTVSSSDSAERTGQARGALMRGPGEHLSALADKLGVSEDELTDALGAVREDLGPPRRNRRTQRPTRAQLERRCNQITDALAKELDKSGDDVRAAIKAVAREKIEEAVDADRLTRSQADRMLSRIEGAACLLAFGPGPGGHGCGGPGGGGRFGHPAPPPGESGSEGSSSVAPAPMGAPA
jgi:hypothetical protein